MVKMYIGNASIQRHEFTYRLPEINKARTLPIPPMSQIALADDLSPEGVDAIVKQHESYGFISSADVVKGVTRKRFTRLVYCLGQPVSHMVIEALFRNNQGVLDADGKELRKITAVASSEAVVRQLNIQRETQGLEADVSGFEMTIQEEEPATGYGPTEEVIADGFRVKPEQPNPAPVTRGKRARRA